MLFGGWDQSDLEDWSLKQPRLPEEGKAESHEELKVYSKRKVWDTSEKEANTFTRLTEKEAS